MTKAFLRYLGGRRIGGIIIAFTGPDRRDSYGNYWTKDTDFALQRYDVRPLYFQHRGNLVEAAHIQGEDLVVRDDGLYMECDLLDNETGNACLDLIKRGRGHYSTGVMPNSWEEDEDGWVRLWPIVEVSVTDRPATKFGLTRANIVRSFLDVVEADDEYLRRGPVFDKTPFYWSEGTATSPEAAPVVAPTTPVQPQEGDSAEIAELRNDLRELTNAVRELADREPPTHSLPASDQLPDVLRPSREPANVEVHHRFDQMTTAGLVVWGHLGLQTGRISGERETELMRGLIDKMARQQRRDDAIPEQELMQGALRMIDHRVALDWGERGRHIRADEAMQSTYANYGQELVPTVVSSVLWYHFMLKARVLPALRRIQLPSPTYELPIITGGPTIRLVPELADQANLGVHNSIIPATKIGSDKVAFNAKKIGALVIGSSELFEDAAMGVADMWATQMIRQMASAMDYTILNGDENADVNNISHLGVDPTSTVYDKILACNGLRHFAFDDNGTYGTTVAQTSITSTSNTGLRRKMGLRGRLGMDPKGCVNFVDPNVYYDMLDLTAIESIADFGQYATLLTGAVGHLKGLPIIPSDELENTDANGKIPSTHDASYGSHLTVWVDGILVGYSRGVSFEIAKVFGAEGFAADITVRLDVQKLEDGSVAMGYNVGGS